MPRRRTGNRRATPVGNVTGPRDFIRMMDEIEQQARQRRHAEAQEQAAREREDLTRMAMQAIRDHAIRERPPLHPAERPANQTDESRLREIEITSILQHLGECPNPITGHTYSSLYQILLSAYRHAIEADDARADRITARSCDIVNDGTGRDVIIINALREIGEEPADTENAPENYESFTRMILEDRAIEVGIPPSRREQGYMPPPRPAVPLIMCHQCGDVVLANLHKDFCENRDIPREESGPAIVAHDNPSILPNGGGGGSGESVTVSWQSPVEIRATTAGIRALDVRILRNQRSVFAPFSPIPIAEMQTGFHENTSYIASMNNVNIPGIINFRINVVIREAEEGSATIDAMPLLFSGYIDNAQNMTVGQSIALYNYYPGTEVVVERTGLTTWSLLTRYEAGNTIHVHQIIRLP